MNEKISEQFIGLKLTGIGSNCRKVSIAAENYTNCSQQKLYYTKSDKKRTNNYLNSTKFSNGKPPLSSLSGSAN